MKCSCSHAMLFAKNILKLSLSTNGFENGQEIDFIWYSNRLFINLLH